MLRLMLPVSCIWALKMRGLIMLDLVMLVMGVGFFAIALAYVTACDNL